jgi:hypothetical protein
MIHLFAERAATLFAPSEWHARFFVVSTYRRIPLVTNWRSVYPFPDASKRKN